MVGAVSSGDISALLRRVEALEVECGDLVHLINEASREAMKDHTDSEAMPRRAYDLANAARQGRAIEGAFAVMRYLISEAGKEQTSE